MSSRIRYRRVLFTGILASFLIIVVAQLARAQGRDFGGEEKTNALVYKNVSANAQTRPEDHTMNRHPSKAGWGGCVPSSVRTAALHAGIPRDQIDKFWEIAQQRVGVGGTDPQLLAAMLKQGMPDQEWISVVDSDPATISKTMDKLSAEGHCLSGTMGWGQLYGPGRKIAHMVSVPHYSSKDGYACVEDNNDPPGVYRWMPAKEYLARCMSGGQGWIHAFTALPAVVKIAAAAMLVAVVLLLLASSTAVVGWAGWHYLQPSD